MVVWVTGACVISWGQPVRGREGMGLETFGKAIARFEQLAKQGRIHSHKEYFAVTGNTGKLSGFMIIEGQLDELFKINQEEEQARLLAESQAIVENFSIRFYAGGSDRAVQERVTTYGETLQALGLM